MLGWTRQRQSDAYNIGVNSIDPNGSENVLKFKVTEISCFCAEEGTRQVVRSFGQDDSPRLRVLLQPCCEVHSITKDAALLQEDSPKMNADPQRNGYGCRAFSLPRG